MEKGDRVSIIGMGRRRGFRRWGTATVLSGGTDMVRVQFDQGDPFDAYCWSSGFPRVDQSAERPILLARPIAAASEETELSCV